MKNLFTLLSLAAVSFAANAESVTVGYYDGNSVKDLSSVGMGQAYTYNVAMKLPGCSVLGGATIEALRLPTLNLTNLTDVSVWVADLNMTPISEVAVDKANMTKTTFNEVALTNQVVIPAEGVYVGATFTLTKATSNSDKYPVCCNADCKYAEEGLLLKEGELWIDYSTQFGAYGMQAVVSGVQSSSASAYFGTFGTGYTGAGKDFDFEFPIFSNGNTEVNNIEYVIEVDGKVETRTADVQIPAGVLRLAKVAGTITGPETPGNYEVKMAVTKVNGVANDCAEVYATSHIENVPFLAVRRSVVEEFTGTGCGYCPRGLKGMDNLKKGFGDRFIGVGIHQYNSSDPMYTANYANLNFTGAPSCKIDRGDIIDPFYGSSNDIRDDFKKALEVWAPVDIELTAYWQDSTDFEADHLYVDIEASITAIDAGDYKIDFVLTADSLCGTTTAWKQSNYYNTSNASANPGLEEFCKNGEYGKSSFFYNFDDVLIGSSYSNKTNKAEPLGKMEAGEVKTSTYTIALPTKKTLLDAIKASIDKVYGIVIITEAKTKKVVNANRVNVVVKPTESGIIAVENDVRYAPAGRYTLDGKHAAEGQKGFTVVRMSDGTVRKELR